MNPMPPITAILIDDEPNARMLLREMLKMACPHVQVLAECADLPNGVKAIRKHKPMLVFLDIEMPGHSGLELLDFFNEDEVDFSIIFTTAYHAYAIQAFKLNAIDYLLKPLEIAELEDAVARFSKRHGQSNLPQVRNMSQLGQQRKIAVPSGNTIKLLQPEQILYLKADNTYTEVFLLDGSKLVVSRTLKNFEDSLADDKTFFRCHKSYIVNMAYVTQLNKSDGGSLLIHDHIEVPISQERVQEFIELLSMIRR
jgi:two-component system, LytTR family, response regulator